MKTLALLGLLVIGHSALVAAKCDKTCSIQQCGWTPDSSSNAENNLEKVQCLRDKCGCKSGNLMAAEEFEDFEECYKFDGNICASVNDQSEKASCYA